MVCLVSGAARRGPRPGPVLINHVVYGEVAYRFSLIEELDEALPRTGSSAATCRGHLPARDSRNASVTVTTGPVSSD